MKRVLEPHEFGQFFSSFTTSAFRLETLDSYDVDEDDEREAVKLFEMGEDLPDWYASRSWTGFVRDATAAGKSVERVHLLPNHLTNYLKFEIDWGYVTNERAGERIWLKHGSMPGVTDFWLFDNSRAIVMEYDRAGHFLGGTLTDEQDDVEMYTRLREEALENALPLSAYLQESD